MLIGTTEDKRALDLWENFRKLSIVEYIKLYERLNVTFDVYGGESKVEGDSIQKVMEDLRQRGLLTTKAADEGGQWKKEKAKGKADAAGVLEDLDPFEDEAPTGEASPAGPLAQAVDLLQYDLGKPVLQKPGE